MPWVNENMCVGCGVCVDDCPVEAITLNNDRKVIINDNKCIRCGKCHDVCPQDAVRHDSERIPQEVEANITKTKELLQHFDSPQEQGEFYERMIRYFNKEKKVADLTIAQITDLRIAVNKEE